MNAIRRSYARLPSWHAGFQQARMAFAIGRRTVALWLFAFLLLTPAVFAATKTLSGKLREVKDNALTIQEDHLLNSSMIQVEMNDQTKVTGELAQGMHIKVKYREEREGKGSDKAAVHRIAMEIQTWPESASKEDRKAEKDAQQ
jgi:hypothetical protein